MGENVIKTAIARDIAKVRESGLTNMFDRNKVIRILNVMDCKDSAKYLKNHEDEYMEMLKLSGEY